mmetsp:Transcript_2007/g.5403  ORF Transcript_2007/g.5403 Transcript_2007/m.5403 type:complete len:206 (+) Transcript_2007:477-1094(+)|eukprot:CAMPEP_0174892832 /NCGR_PEP_ID=MMETSP0167-20121228/7730_1 /TAXON_ID=38298 /ORGANISM="Rhodella maculata, Strain CCMP736" /LENGTH=205 /DNA_ID=CAMNT_0016131445 /DNA_START=457 /DNA_END=1074 /DNA_ORIENTATION=+
MGWFDLEKEDIAWVLRGRENLRELSAPADWLHPEVIAALPSSIESLKFASTERRSLVPALDESLRIMGRLPNLTCLSMDSGRNTDWAGLLPVASRLEVLETAMVDCADAKLIELVRAGVNLKYLQILVAEGNFEQLLVSSLPKLLYIRLVGGGYGDETCKPLQLRSEKGLLALASGTASKSLAYCSFLLTGGEVLFDESLNRCFK